VRKHWKIVVERPPRLCETVLENFKAVSEKDSRRARGLLFSDTCVTFLDAWGAVEEGQDEGGLSAEMFSLFWKEVVRPEAGLFEPAADGGTVLPRADAPAESLRAVGVVMVKCILDDHPIGAGMQLGVSLSAPWARDSHDAKCP
jgi:hypothetical protein